MPKPGSLTGLFDHTALKASERDLNEFFRPVKEAGDVEYLEIDHSCCRSRYIHADGYRLEFASDPPNAHSLMAERLGNARTDLDRWLTGNLASNNDVCADA